MSHGSQIMAKTNHHKWRRSWNRLWMLSHRQALMNRALTVVGSVGLPAGSQVKMWALFSAGVPVMPSMVPRWISRTATVAGSSRKVRRLWVLVSPVFTPSDVVLPPG